MTTPPPNQDIKDLTRSVVRLCTLERGYEAQRLRLDSIERSMQELTAELKRNRLLGEI